MPIKARFIVPDCPYHIEQRGYNRQALFASNEDSHDYLNNLQHWKEELGCKVYAFCLIINSSICFNFSRSAVGETPT